MLVEQAEVGLQVPFEQVLEQVEMKQVPVQVRVGQAEVGLVKEQVGMEQGLEVEQMRSMSDLFEPE